jgi:hypothetical protein
MDTKSNNSDVFNNSSNRPTAKLSAQANKQQPKSKDRSRIKVSHTQVMTSYYLRKNEQLNPSPSSLARRKCHTHPYSETCRYLRS